MDVNATESSMLEILFVMTDILNQKQAAYINNILLIYSCYTVSCCLDLTVLYTLQWPSKIYKFVTD